MLFGDDAVSMDTDNANIWIHHNDFFYGAPGSDADQVKGDGTIDMKYNSSNITISYNHFWESGKSMGCGGSTETVPTFYVTFHHNWFDHVDSRNPRLHYTTAHVYNNYFDGVSKYCIGNTTETSAFVEANHFRHCDRPMMISGQGTAALELIEEVGQLDAFFTCLGGGGLLAGSCLAVKALSPACRIYGVEPEAGNDVQQSFRTGKPVRIEVPKTIADGAQTQLVGKITFL